MRTRSPVVVGRDRELDVLRGALDSARAGRGAAVFLVGEPGIGKTRLAATATGMAFDAGMRALRGRGGGIGPMVPFRPLVEALMSLFRGGEPPEAGELGPYRQVLGRLTPEWGGTTAQPVGVSLVVLAEAVLRLLSLVGRECGCLLVLDDLQDADAETLTVVEYLVDNVQAQPVQLVVTVRSEPCDALALARLAGQRGTAELVALGRLDRAQVAAMAASCLDVAGPQRLPGAVLDRLWADSAGLPFVVEELLQEMVGTGLLAPVADGWQLVGAMRTRVPAALVSSVGVRIDRLGPQVRTLLSAAAVLGQRFPLSVVRVATGTDDRTLLANLHAGVAAQLVTSDEPAPDWYAFRHPLTAEALLAGLTPAERAELSGRAADAVEALHPDLPGDWCQLVATLRLAVGDPARAGRLFAVAGRRALDHGAPDSAVTLLDRAHRLLTEAAGGAASGGSGPAEVADLADVLEALLRALGETGQFERAFRLAAAIDELGARGLPRPRRAALHTRLAWVADGAGRWVDGLAQVDAARALLGPDAADADTAPVDVIAASLTLSTVSPDRLATATMMVRRGVAAAARAGLAEVECEAWQLLGMIAREHDLVEADAYVERSLVLAEQHHLPFRRIYALALRAGTACLVDGDVTGLARARHEALRVGALAQAYGVDAILALQAVLRGEFAAAAGMIDECWEVVVRLRLSQTIPYLMMARATLAAHQGRRREMGAALAEFGGGGLESSVLPLTFGLTRTFCALLEEDRELAVRELAQALTYEAENPTTFHLAGKNGLHLLLGVLDGRMGRAHHQETVRAPASRMRWNAHFVHLADAVLLGREGRTEEADAAAGLARQAGAIYGMAAHLGSRLVAEAAHDAGWGSPVEWLRGAEDYFHQAGVSTAASACRTALRRVGAPVPQRRSGAELVPSALRAAGVTVREYEVFRLLVDVLGNKAIAARLHISPRTVEKHVANLLAKTRQPDRESLHAYARVVLAP